jgi:PhzF family phenazine biosynthesis protein
VSAHYVRAAIQGVTGSFLQKTGAGLQRIRAERHDGDWGIAIRQGIPTFGAPLTEALRDRLAAALGIRVLDIVSTLPVQVVSTGHRRK